MIPHFRRYTSSLPGLLLAICCAAVGCESMPTCCCPPPVPHELSKITPSLYVIEPPDILLIDAVRLVPKPPYHIEPLDQLGISVNPELPPPGIKGIYSVEPAGTVNFGPTYGSVSVLGMTVDEAAKAIEKRLLDKGVKTPDVTVQLAEFKAMQQVRGEHLVRRDGTISLGTYGYLHVDGLTITEAKEAIQAHLSNYLNKPEVSVDVGGFNHDLIYVVSEALVGDSVIKLPCTGKETVLDALATVGGLSQVASRCRITVARPAPSETKCTQILPVDWIGITRRGETATNYQLFPGDRIMVQADPLLKLDATIAKIIGPFERVAGGILLGNSLVRELRMPTTGTGTGNGF